jgi:acyl-CoA hydrolase
MNETREDHHERLERLSPEKFTSEEELFSRIRRGNSIFIGTACGNPQHLMESAHPHQNSKERGSPGLSSNGAL